MWVYKGDHLGRNDAPVVEEPQDDRRRRPGGRPDGRRREGEGGRPGGNRRGGAGAGAGRRAPGADAKSGE